MRSADGTDFRASAAVPLATAEATAAGIVVLPDFRGLSAFYEEVGVRLAEHGHSAVVIDYYGRTAGLAERGEDFSPMEHAMQLTPDGIQADVAAAIAHLRSDAGGSCERVFTLGFCMGGQHSWLAAAAGHDLAGVIGFYGSPVQGPDGSPGPVSVIDRIAAPVLALQGGQDQVVPVADSERFDRELTAAGIEHEVVIYPAAPHSFFDRLEEGFAEEGADAWRRTLDFIAHNSVGVTA